MYTAYSDGSTRNGRSGIGYIIFKDEQPVYRCRKQIDVHNPFELEYIALTELLKKINDLKIKDITAFVDLKSITDHLALIGSGKRIKNKNERIKDIIYEKSISNRIRIEKDSSE